MPHYHLVGRYVVERICLAPSILAETCRLIASTPRDFLYFTLSHSLPPLASKAAREEIDEIAREIDMGVSQMVMEKLTEVLTYIFLLETPTDTEKGLKFVTGLVAEAAESKGGSVSLPALVKSCAVQLLSEIVMVLGEEDPHKVSLVRLFCFPDIARCLTVLTKAIQALAKVERKLATGRGPRSSVGDLGAFLKFYMVGIISYLSEVLQDVQGKKSPAAKKQVIRSIGVLVQKVGPSMSSVSPQVRFF
jgi:serine/threonine-protein kinase ATR